MTDKKIIDWEDAIMSYCNKCRIKWTNCSVCEKCGSKTEQFVHLEDVKQALSEKEKEFDAKLDKIQNDEWDTWKNMKEQISDLKAEKKKMLEKIEKKLMKKSVCGNCKKITDECKCKFPFRMVDMIIWWTDVMSILEELKKGSDSK